jgi:hypothetical protein
LLEAGLSGSTADTTTPCPSLDFSSVSPSFGLAGDVSSVSVLALASF